MSRSMLYSPWRACARMCALVSRRLFSVRACACRVLGTPVWGGCFLSAMHMRVYAVAGVCGVGAHILRTRSLQGVRMLRRVWPV